MAPPTGSERTGAGQSSARLAWVQVSKAIVGVGASVGANVGEVVGDVAEVLGVWLAPPTTCGFVPCGKMTPTAMSTIAAAPTASAALVVRRVANGRHPVSDRR